MPDLLLHLVPLRKSSRIQENLLRAISATSTYFILFRKGVRCFDDVLENLRKAKDIGSEETKGDIEIIHYVMQKLDGTAIKIPQSRVSERGTTLRSALMGKNSELMPKPDSIIDEMILTLARDLSEKMIKSLSKAKN